MVQNNRLLATHYQRKKSLDGKNIRMSEFFAERHYRKTADGMLHHTYVRDLDPCSKGFSQIKYRLHGFYGRAPSSSCLLGCVSLIMSVLEFCYNLLYCSDLCWNSSDKLVSVKKFLHILFNIATFHELQLF